MKYHEMTKNYFFREFERGLSTEETAELCFKSVSTVKGWRKGNAFPINVRGSCEDKIDSNYLTLKNGKGSK